MDIQTPNLTLVLQSTEQVLAWIELMSQRDRAQVSPNWLARVRASGTADPWTHGFSIVHQGSGKTIGSCAFKGPPDADGVVEIAYGVDPAHQGRGHATEAAAALTAWAFTQPDVRIVRAHTLPQTSASTRVLTKCGFEHRGDVIDPEDGRVWRWQRGSNATTAAVVKDR